jgi:hypothetical protein
MNQFFPMFLHKSLWPMPLTLLFKRSDFGFEFSEIFVFENRLPASVSRGVDKIAWSIHCKTHEEPISVKTPRKSLHCHVPLRKWKKSVLFFSVLQIRILIRRNHMFLGLLDPDPDPLVRGMVPDPDPAPDPSIFKQKK